MKKAILGEVHDMLRILPFEQLKMFAAIRQDQVQWKLWQEFAYDQKRIKLDQIYRLHRPKDQNELIRNAIDHEYYAARIAAFAMLLQIIENAGEELERRARKEK